MATIPASELTGFSGKDDEDGLLAFETTGRELRGLMDTGSDDALSGVRTDGDSHSPPHLPPPTVQPKVRPTPKSGPKASHASKKQGSGVQPNPLLHESGFGQRSPHEEPHSPTPHEEHSLLSPTHQSIACAVVGEGLQDVGAYFLRAEDDGETF